MEFAWRARFDRRAHAWNSIGAGFAASAVWRNDRLGCGHGAAVVEHPGLAGAFLPDHAWLDLRSLGAAEPDGHGLAKAVCEQRGQWGHSSPHPLSPGRGDGPMGHLTEMGDHRVGSGNRSRLPRFAAATE